MDSIESDTQTGSTIFGKNILNFQLQSAALCKVVVREIYSGLYLDEVGLLTQEIEHAKRFDSATAAILEASCRGHYITEIVSLD